MKILINHNDWNQNPERRRLNTYGGVGYYRLIKPSQQIQRHEVTVWGDEITKWKTYEDRWDDVFKNFDVYWTNYFSDEKTATAIFTKRDEYKKKVIIDLDDNFWDILPTHPLYDRFKMGKRERAFISTILSFADVITTSTEPLKERIESHMRMMYGLDKKVVVIPNMNDIDDWNFKSSNNKDKIVIGYAGSNSHEDDLAMIVKPLRLVMEKHKNVHFECVGIISKEMLHLFRDFSEDALKRCDALGGTLTFNEYPKFLSKRKWDISIAPLVDSSFTRCKSHQKWMESAMYKIPTIASKVYPYYVESFGRQTIEDNITGILCKPYEWEQKLNLLIENKELRKRIGENAYEFVKKEWQYKDSNISQVVDDMLK